jgi:hemerythrin
MSEPYGKYAFVGNEMMDCDHGILISMFDRLYKNKNTEFVVHDLLKYSIEHFDREETIMRDIGYPDILIHKKQHAWFTNKVSSVIKSGIYNNDNIQSFLRVWLVNHIAIMDAELSQYIKLHTGSDRLS